MTTGRKPITQLQHSSRTRSWPVRDTRLDYSAAPIITFGEEDGVLKFPEAKNSSDLQKCSAIHVDLFRALEKGVPVAKTHVRCMVYISDAFEQTSKIRFPITMKSSLILISRGDKICGNS